jgi:hypothetical protein
MGRDAVRFQPLHGLLSRACHYDGFFIPGTVIDCSMMGSLVPARAKQTHHAAVNEIFLRIPRNVLVFQSQ